MSPKQIHMFLPDLQKKDRVWYMCCGYSKEQSQWDVLWATKTYVWLDNNITMMSDTCVVGSQRNSLCETFFECPKHIFGSITVSRWNSCTFRLMSSYILFSSINNMYNISLPLLVNTVLWLFCIMCRLPSLRNSTFCIALYCKICWPNFMKVKGW